jgi:hypothetical protein
LIGLFQNVLKPFETDWGIGRQGRRDESPDGFILVGRGDIPAKPVTFPSL